MAKWYRGIDVQAVENQIQALYSERRAIRQAVIASGGFSSDGYQKRRQIYGIENAAFRLQNIRDRLRRFRDTGSTDSIEY